MKDFYLGKSMAAMVKHWHHQYLREIYQSKFIKAENTAVRDAIVTMNDSPRRHVSLIGLFAVLKKQ